ncbi:hypothetical protein [Psychrobium sp. 1_MG-2023]|uniref:hypothetical protein n=1 Tax=Psychrobium sp. 1_MG-2023 TaxID=3062624 RepID=UPI000C32881A|nr:hypothetical protein [Psychrobium sp. 1_MG-2023]MDP2562576.1 hypothetical protein [Psychrobium sp. 1_MG-2023]PKF59657.1 hypothetical protein CW748_00145 [Alteromonadales bacterium alter-6D02]
MNDSETTNQSQSASNQQTPVSFAFDEQKQPLSLLTLQWLKRSYLLLVALLCLLLALYWVLFYLPTSDLIPAQQAIHTQPSQPTGALPAKRIEQSPWQDAQQAKLRRQAQDILSVILTQQTKLEAMGVTKWANLEYLEAINKAHAGDEHYQQQQFSIAIDTYQQVLTLFTAIEASSDEHFTRYLAAGEQALAQNNASLAKQKLTVALQINPNHQAATQAYDRSLVLDQVNTLINQGKVLVSEQKLIEAKTQFSKAIALDSHSQAAREQLQSTDLAITQRDFSAEMSKGYKQMHQHRYHTAIKHFKQAKQLYATSANGVEQRTMAQQAITQSSNLLTQGRIDTFIAQAKVLEQQEAWQLVIEQYQQALSLDSSLITAKVGQLSAQARLQQQKQLNQIINKPLRLNNERIYQQSLSHYQQALKTLQPGPKLAEQLVQVKYTLTQAKTPVSVKIDSDNYTDVTLYKVGNLGNFSTKTLTLTPGLYTIVGSRDGFQDVRHQFSINANEKNKTILVQCDKRVTNG